MNVNRTAAIQMLSATTAQGPSAASAKQVIMEMASTVYHKVNFWNNMLNILREQTLKSSSME